MCMAPTCQAVYYPTRRLGRFSPPPLQLPPLASPLWSKCAEMIFSRLLLSTGRASECSRPISISFAKSFVTLVVVVHSIGTHFPPSLITHSFPLFARTLSSPSQLPPSSAPFSHFSHALRLIAAIKQKSLFIHSMVSHIFYIFCTYRTVYTFRPLVRT